MGVILSWVGVGLFLPLFAEVFSSHDTGNYGCVSAPNVCVPPEDCNGVTGNCQMPLQGDDQDYDDRNKDLERVLRAVETFGYYGFVSQNFGEPSVPDDDSTALIGLENTRNQVRNRLLKTENRLSDESTYEAEKHTTIQNSKSNMRIHIDRLLDKVQDALAQNGRRLTDLTENERSLLVKYLANFIKNGKFHENYDSGWHDSSKSRMKSVQTNEESELHGGALHIGSSNKDMMQKSHVLKNQNDIGRDTVEVPDDAQDVGAALDVMEAKPAISVAAVSLVATSPHLSAKSEIQKDTLYIVIIVVGATVLLIILVTIVSCIYYWYQRKRQRDIKFIESMTSRAPVGNEYQDLCRQHYATKSSEAKDVNDSDDNTYNYPIAARKPIDTVIEPNQRSFDKVSDPAARNSSVSSMSWNEEPVTANLELTTGHVVLAYMEDHLANKDRLDKEWREICNYETDSISPIVPNTPQNSSKNRVDAALPYDHNRVKLNISENYINSDYINASKIIDNDPKRPLYIAAQGPLPSTVSDFWQMVWEQDCVAIVMLTALVEEGVNQCARYWPDEGSSRYHNFEINLVSEHIWCEDYLVRSLYLKHTVTGETRTVTQFHFLSWPKDGVPSTPKPLLEMRRKVTKCYKAYHSPVLVHCSDGIGRTGTYILLDLAINRMLKKPKEIDIAATLEHIRDQRIGMVANKEQFEFALTAVAEEVNAILESLSH